jgi:hypothetical protein
MEIYFTLYSLSFLYITTASRRSLSAMRVRHPTWQGWRECAGKAYVACEVCSFPHLEEHTSACIPPTTPTKHCDNDLHNLRQLHERFLHPDNSSGTM